MQMTEFFGIKYELLNQIVLQTTLAIVRQRGYSPKGIKMKLCIYTKKYSQITSYIRMLHLVLCTKIFEIITWVQLKVFCTVHRL